MKPPPTFFFYLVVPLSLFDYLNILEIQSLKLEGKTLMCHI